MVSNCMFHESMWFITKHVPGPAWCPLNHALLTSQGRHVLPTNCWILFSMCERHPGFSDCLREHDGTCLLSRVWNSSSLLNPYLKAWTHEVSLLLLKVGLDCQIVIPKSIFGFHSKFQMHYASWIFSRTRRPNPQFSRGSARSGCTAEFAHGEWSGFGGVPGGMPSSEFIGCPKILPPWLLNGKHDWGYPHDFSDTSNQPNGFHRHPHGRSPSEMVPAWTWWSYELMCWWMISHIFLGESNKISIVNIINVIFIHSNSSMCCWFAEYFLKESWKKHDELAINHKQCSKKASMNHRQ